MELQILLSNYRKIKEASETSTDNDFKADAKKAIDILTPHFEDLQEMELATIEKLKSAGINDPMILGLLPTLS